MEIYRVGLKRNLSIEGSKAAWVRGILDHAISNNLKPCLLDQSDVDSFIVRLPRKMTESIASIARSHGLNPVMASAGLIMSACDPVESSDPKNTPDRIGNHVKDELLSLVRPELHAWLEDGVRETLGSKIVAMEAATGSGKGRAICAAALTHLSLGSTVTISAPMEVLFQLSDSFRLFGDPAYEKHGIFLGRPNFVNENVVLDHANETGNQTLKEWIEQGGKPLGKRANDYMQATGTTLAYLMDDAISLAADLPVRECQLSPQDHCKAQQAYEAAKLMVAERPIMLMSHHMLAAGVFSKDDGEGSGFAFFRKNDQLIIDEAHLFEEAVSSLSSTTIHGSVLAKRFSGYPKVIKACDAFNNELVNVCLKDRAPSEGRHKHSYCDSNSAPGLFYALIDLNDQIKTHVRSKSKRRDLLPYIAGLKQIQEDLKNSYAMTRVALSPVKKLPSISSGSYQLKYQLEKIWKNYSGVMLVSATLLGGRGDAALLGWILRLPKERLSVIKPVTPRWIAESLDIHRRFTDSVDFGSEEWLDQVSEKCAQIINSAQGGLLILTTSFDTCSGLAERLVPIYGDRLIAQSPKLNAGSCKARYIELYSRGVMPIWIGVGRAWVGVDLTDESVEARDDHLISDLIVPKIPYLMTQSMVSQYRNLSGHYGVMAQEAAWVLRQGIGRLVRRQDCSKKHVWLLDRRISEPAHEVILKNLDRFMS